MKRSFRPLFVAASAGLVLSLAACKDYLNVTPTAVDTSAAVFSTVSGAYAAVIGAYDPMSGDTGYGNRLSCYYPYDSEDFLNVPTGNDAGVGRRGIARYSSVTNNAEVENPWNTLYQGIERANICIKYIPQMAQYSAEPDSAAVRRLHGEALTLRAQYYFELLRNWGDVPASYEPTVTGQDFNIPQVDRDLTYDHILDDLALASRLLPWRSKVTADERITKGAAKALRARVALYRAGYSVRSNGVSQRSGDYRKYYTIARDECAQLMANRGEHDLNASFEENFRSICEKRRDAKREIMFEVGMGGASSTSDSKLGYYNGPRLTASPKYGQSSGAIIMTYNYFYAFDSLDTRRDVTIAPYTIDNTDQKKPTTAISSYDGKFRRDWVVPAVPAIAVQSLGLNWPLIRFSDVLLMYAEAENEINNGPTAAGRSALMEVRNRAYRGNLSAAAQPASTYTGFFQDIANERNREFGGEGIRKYDLIRWNLLGSKFAEIRATLRGWVAETGTGPYANIPASIYYTVQPNGEYRVVNSFYRPAPAVKPVGSTEVKWRTTVTEARVADIASGYVEAHQLLPIPATAINTNSRLVQNAGY